MRTLAVSVDSGADDTDRPDTANIYDKPLKPLSQSTSLFYSISHFNEIHKRGPTIQLCENVAGKLALSRCDIASS